MNKKSEIMNSKLSKRLLTVILLLLSIIIAVVIYYQNKEYLKSTESKEFAPYYDYILGSAEDPVVGCILGGNQGGNYCYKRADRTFSKADFLDNLPEIKDFPSGLYILRLHNKAWEEFPVDKEELLNKWYTDISANESMFLREVDSNFDVSLYSLVKFRRIQILKNELSKEDFIKELSKYSKAPYRISMPMSYSDLTYVCSLVSSESCDSWKVHQEIPYKFIKSINEDSSFDYKDLRNLWSRMKFLNVGYNSIDLLDEKNESKVFEYEKFLNKVITINPQFSREKISFLSDYLPLNFIDFIDPLFDYWNKEFANNYLWILGATCGDEECLDIKLNTIYDEYTK